jgi:N-ethylmaleimide reductase
MAPMTRSRAINFLPNDLMVSYYEQRATAGLIISEGVAPSKNGLGYARTPGIYSQKQIEGWKKVTEAVHAKGGKIFIQLMHVGRIAHEANQPEGARILGASPIRAKGEMWTDSLGKQEFPIPQEMSKQDIEQVKQEFVQGAKNAIEAGFNGVELHGANGYLLEQFLNPGANQRSDEYGGSVENRSRLILEIADAVISAIGKEKTGIRLSPYNTYNDLPTYEEAFTTYDYIAKELNKRGILFIHLIDYASLPHAEGQVLVQKIRQNFKNILIRNGGYNKERAEAVLSTGEADLISFGSPFIANPDLPERLKKNIPLTAPIVDFFYSPGEKGYIDYSFA